MTSVVLVTTALAVVAIAAFVAGACVERRGWARDDARRARLMTGTAFGARKAIGEGQLDAADAGLESLTKCELLRWKQNVKRRERTELERIRTSKYAHDRFFLEAYDRLAPKLAREEELRRQAGMLPDDELDKLVDQSVAESTGMTVEEAADLRRQIDEAQKRRKANPR